jgi:Protein of unknown function (DUF992)
MVCIGSPYPFSVDRLKQTAGTQQGPQAKRGALAGDYAGVDASATLGAGVCANALVGGFGRSLTLQPISVEAQSGLALPGKLAPQKGFAG